DSNRRLVEVVIVCSFPPGDRQSGTRRLARNRTAGRFFFSARSDCARIPHPRKTRNWARGSEDTDGCDDGSQAGNRRTVVSEGSAAPERPDYRWIGNRRASGIDLVVDGRRVRRPRPTECALPLLSARRTYAPVAAVWRLARLQRRALESVLDN